MPDLLLFEIKKSLRGSKELAVCEAAAAAVPANNNCFDDPKDLTAFLDFAGSKVLGLRLLDELRAPERKSLTEAAG